jgi:hypothetical protein
MSAARTKRALAALLLIVLPLGILPLGGCAVRASQLETVRGLWYGLRTSEVAAPFAWQFEFNGVGYTVYPVAERAGRVIFANGSGLTLEWDGEFIVVVEGLPGAIGVVRIERSERSVRYRLGEGGFVTLDCGSRRAWRISPTQHGLRRECLGEDRHIALRSIHEVEFDTQDRPAVIRSTLVPGAPAATLTRAVR